MNELSNKNDELTDKQKKLVDTIVTTGCSITEAAKIAGYSTKKSKDTARVIASRTLRIPKVQQYMMKQVSSQIGLGAVTASNKLIKLAESAKSEYVQLEASKDILDRAGFKAPDKHMDLHACEIKVQIDLS